jgi:lipopolysaccharide export system protein LptA
MKPRLAALLCLAALVGSPVLTHAAEEPPIPPTEITARHMESRSTDTEMTTVFTSDVVVTGNNIRLTCDRLDAVSVRIGSQDQVVARQNRFKSLVATGHVKIVQGDREATCGLAVVLPDDDKIILTENPVVVDHSADVTWNGDKLWLLRGERRVYGDNVHMILPPIKDLGFDKDKKVESPETAPPAPASAKPPEAK